MLYRQGFGIDSIPTLGKEILLREDAYLAYGATQHDVTDQVHPEVARLAIDAAEVIGLDIAGIDIVCHDITSPTADQDIAVLEVNAEPAIILHLAPFTVPARPVAEAIVKTLFPSETNGRIPILASLAAPHWRNTWSVI